MSSSREETNNNVKNSINNTFNNLADSENGRKVFISFKDRERLTRFFNENKLAVILGTVLVVILAIYFIVYNRIPRYLIEWINIIKNTLIYSLFNIIKK